MPEAFLVMLLIQFSTMVVDRALYLRKTVLGKLAFQVVLVLAIHLWMFFILPAVTERWVLGARALHCRDVLFSTWRSRNWVWTP